MLDRTIFGLKKRRELIVRKIERYTAERFELLGKENYYGDEIQRILNKEKGKKTEERVEFLDGRLKELKNKLGRVNKFLSWENNETIREKEKKKTENKQNETKFLIIFLALLAITGLFLFSDYLKLEFGPTGFVVSSGVSNATEHLRGSVIGGNVTFELRLGDFIPNDTYVNVSFEGNQSNTTILEHFIYTSSELLVGTTEPNSTNTIFNNVDGVSTWEGLTGYGYSVNETPEIPFDGGNITVDLDNLFEGGLIAPSIGGVYEIILNATFENETGELVVTSSTSVEVQAIPSDPTFLAVNSTATDAQNYTNETLNFNAFVSDPNTNDILTCIVSPFKDGANQTGDYARVSCSDPQSFVYELDSANTSKGELWSFSLDVCDDGNECSNTIFSENFTINNYPPTANGTLSNTTQPEDFANLADLIPVADFNANFTDIDEIPNSYTIIAQSNSSTSCYLDASNNLDCSSVADASGTDLYTFELNDTDNAAVRFDWQITVNASPSQPTLNLPENNSQIDTDVLTVELNWSNSTDSENDAITYYLEIWNDTTETNIMYVNSSIAESANTTSDLVTFPNETKDYFWRVLATDSGSNSSFSDLRNISIIVTPTNTAPNDPIGVIINSTTADQLNQTNETLDMNFYCDDPEGDVMNWSMMIYRNGGSPQFGLSGTCADNAYTVVKLEDANTSISELWSFGVNLNDGSLFNPGSYIYSNNITIENTAPTISDVSLAGQSYSPTAGGTTEIEISFLADEIDGTDHLDNSTALVNISYQSLTGAGLLTDSNSSCSSATIDTDTMNYSCYVQLEYFWDHSTVWTVDAQISDINSSLDLNSSNQASDGLNWTVQELIASNFSSTSLSWAGVVPLDTNASSTTNLTNENIGNSLSLLLTTIVIDLGASETATYIPAINFTVFNITNTDKIECDYTNQTEAVNSGVKPFVGVNNTAIVWLNNTLKRGQGTNPETANYCLFDVPSSLISGEYNTSFGGAWDLTTGDSGE